MIEEFSGLMEKREAVKSLIRLKQREKELFSAEIAKSSKEISLLEGIIAEVYTGNVDVRCKWLWEKGSMAGFVYTTNQNDADDIVKLKGKILEERANMDNLSKAARDTKAEIVELENDLPYALIDINIKVMRTSTDDNPKSKSAGSLYHIFEIDRHEYKDDGKLVYSSHIIKFIRKEPGDSDGFPEWRELRPSVEDKLEFREIPIEQAPKWAYIIKKFLKPRLL